MTYQTANHGSQIEYHPEPRYVSAFGLFGRVGHHDGTLRAPEQTSTHTEKRSRESSEAQILRVIVGQVGSNIDRVADTTERESSTNTELVSESASEEANNGERGIQRCIGFVVCSGVKLTTSSHAVEGVEHAGAHEANQ